MDGRIVVLIFEFRRPGSRVHRTRTPAGNAPLSKNAFVFWLPLRTLSMAMPVTDDAVGLNHRNRENLARRRAPGTGSPHV